MNYQKRMLMRVEHALRILVLATVALLAACANTAGKDKPAQTAGPSTTDGVKVSTDPQAPLERRATDRWKLLIAGDAAGSYAYLTPGYRATNTPEQYAEWLRTRQVNWKAALYTEHQCESPDVCKVDLIISGDVTMRGISSRQSSSGMINESWLRIDGVWYHLPKETR